jgi:CubicO group peptidase (beta-lactamase class C family)
LHAHPDPEDNMILPVHRGLLAAFSLSLLVGCDLLTEPASKPTSEPTKFNRNIDPEAHAQMERLLAEGIAVFAFHPDGGWVIVTEKGSKFARNIPEECNQKLEEFLAAGHKIRSIAFPPQGGNRWVIVTDRTKFARNIPAEANEQLERFLAQGHKVLSVAFPYRRTTDNSWVILAEDDFFARNIDDEAYQIIRNFMQRPRPGAARSRPVHDVAFAPGGGWVVLGEDDFYARNIDDEAFQTLGNFWNDKRQIAIVAFDPDGNGWSIISNEKYTTRPELDEIQLFERNVGGETVSQRRRTNNVPGVSVAVVVDNRLAWSTGYGHLVTGGDDAAHPESLYQAASISKVLAAIGMHRLVDDGDINLDSDILDDLSVAVPSRPCLNGNPAILLRDVLSHVSPVMGRSTTRPMDVCSGFTANVGGGYSGYAAGASLPTLNQIIAGTGSANTPAITRSRFIGGMFSYSGDGFTLLQKLTEDLTGDSFSNWMQEEILDPMGMDDSFFSTTVPQRFFDARNVATGHSESGARISGDRRQYPEFAAAGLYSTARDLARVIIMLNQDGVIGGTRILSAAARDSLVVSGIGIFVNGGANVTANADFYLHGGTNDGFRSLLVGIPGERAGVVVMTNGDARFGATFREELVQAVINAYGW